VKDYRW